MSLEKYKSKLFTAAVIVLDMYRVGTGTLLVLFVPGVCGGRACLPMDNWNNGDTLYRVGVACNLLTLLTFAALYAAEIRRENRLNTYLTSSPELPMDSENVGLSIQRLTETRRTRLRAVLRGAVCGWRHGGGVDGGARRCGKENPRGSQDAAG